MTARHTGRGRFRVAAHAALPVAALAPVLLIVLTAGCGKSPEYPPNLTFPPRADRLVLKLPDKPAATVNDPNRRNDEIAALDSLGGKTADPAGSSAEERAKVETFLKTTFGTPAAPTVATEGEAATRLKLTAAHLAEGSKLFRAKCQQCHNLVGDGRGTSGATIPFPRDYRQGVFKFVTSNASGKPRRADLVRVITDGLKGTPMPSFALMPEGERDLLAGYVVYLAVRGQVEFEGLRATAEGRADDHAARVKTLLGEWEKAEAAAALPAEPDDGEAGTPKHQDAVRRGLTLFTAKADNSCVSCHDGFGRKPVLRYEVWGTVAKPANLTDTTLKAGSKPEDVFARVRFGVPAVGMPAHPEYTDRQVWDLVRLVRALPYPAHLPEDVRDTVYPK